MDATAKVATGSMLLERITRSDSIDSERMTGASTPSAAFARKTAPSESRLAKSGRAQSRSPRSPR
jgi:hypothetical protein